MYHSLNDKNYKDGEHIRVCQRLRRKVGSWRGVGSWKEVGVALKEQCGDGNVQYHDCSNASLPKLALHCCFTRC